MCNEKEAGRVFAIADLHLDHTGDKSMEVFGSAWKDYEERLFRNWREVVTDDDLVLVPGDISWALKLDEAVPDLERLDALPGEKLLLRGNHDYWWQSISKIAQKNFKTINLLQNNSFEWKDAVIYGTRGWSNPVQADGDDQDQKIFARELERLKLSFSNKSDNPVRICMLHYPPFNHKGEMNAFWELICDNKISIVIYGHLHGYGHALIREGDQDGTGLFCVSADYLEFTPKQLT